MYRCVSRIKNWYLYAIAGCWESLGVLLDITRSHNQYCGCWWTGDARSWASVGMMWPEFPHSESHVGRDNFNVGYPCMMTSSNGNIFGVTGALWVEFTAIGEFSSQRPVSRSCDVFFDLCLNKRFSKPSRRRWFEMPSRSLWRHCNGCSFRWYTFMTYQ